jgi:hypothetical protein
MTMNLKFLTSVGLIAFGLSNQSSKIHAQGDTTWVNTYTWEAQNNPETNYDSPGKRWFDFPSSDNGVEYRKVLMYHKLKCFDQGTAGGLGYACGEWDYLSYNYLFEHTGDLDSTSLIHPMYRMNNLDFDVDSIILFPVSGAPVDTVIHIKERIVHEFTGEVNIATLEDGVITTSVLGGSGNRRIKMFWSAEELLGMGLVGMEDIWAITLNIDNFMADNLTMKIKEADGSDISLSDDVLFENQEWVEVFNYPIDAYENLQIDFYTPFLWDGESGLLIDMALTGFIGNECEVSISPGSVRSFDGYGKYVEFDGGDKIELDANAFQDLSDAVTLECWLKGDADWLPQTTTIFEGVTAENNREINVHMPWSNSRVYWDAGSEGGFDRIDKAATEYEFEGAWAHWAFVKNSTSGVMEIYRNGTLWHTGSDRDNMFGEIKRMYLGSSAYDSYFYRGGVENFRIWKTDLGPEIISDWMHKTDISSHPEFDNLIAIYNFDGPNGTSESEDVESPYGGYYFGDAGRVHHKASELFLDYYETGERPNCSFIQSNLEDIQFDVTSTTTITTRHIPPVSISTWYVEGNSVDWSQIQYGWHHDTESFTYYANGGDTISSSSIQGEITEFVNSELNYFASPYEVLNRFELSRYITPYGINLSLGDDGWTWIFDVTDYLPLLRDSVELECGNWQELLDLKFAFIEGTPPRDVKRVDAFWNGTYYLNSWNDNVTAHEFTPSEGEEMFKMITRASGHWFGEGNNCAEFCYNTHSVLVNDTPQWSWEIMQECADNPLYPQGGTWIYDRAAWCPGAPVTQQEFELTDLVGNSESFTVEYDVTDDPYGNYRMEGQIIAYGEPNMQHDVEIMDILAPNIRKTLSRWNPVCENPVVKIRNNGSEPLTSCMFEYHVQGGEVVNYLWTPGFPLAFLETAEVSLPYNAPEYTEGDDDDILAFNVTVDLVEVYDEESSNNEASSSFRRPPTWAYNNLDDNRIIVWVKTNNAPFETTVELRNKDEVLIWSQSYDIANTVFKDTLELNEGCYRFTILDSGDDGLSFWANNDGGGYARFKKVSGGNFSTIEEDFGKSYSLAFRFETDLISDVEEILEVEKSPTVRIFPNPAIDIVSASLENFSGLVNWKLRTSTGVFVKGGEFVSDSGRLLSIDLEGLASGVYCLSLQTETQHSVSWLVKE